MNRDGPHDAIGRRRRERRVPTGKIKKPTDRNLIWFEKLQRHGPLPSSYLHAYTRHLCRSAAWSRRELADLFHEATVHGAPYLDRPWQQFNTMDARWNDLVYDLTETGQAALADTGIERANPAEGTGSWVHRFMVACITSSVELETLGDPDIRFIFQDEIVSGRLRALVPYIHAGQRQERTLVPDGLFGLAYETGAGTKYRLFALEADRTTEPARSRSFHRKSYARNVLQYREYVGKGLYKKHLGVGAAMVVLNVTTTGTRVQQLVDLVGETSPSGANTFMLFQHLPQFGRVFKPPKLLPQLLRGPWRRAGHEALRIDTP